MASNITFSKNEERLRLVILIVGILGLLCFLPFMSAGAMIYLPSYILFCFALILIKLRVRVGFILSNLVAISLVLLLSIDLKDSFSSVVDHSFIWILSVPYVIFLSLIPLTIAFLLQQHRLKNSLLLLSFVLTFIFPLYLII
jgi:hypothetical protein